MKGTLGTLGLLSCTRLTVCPSHRLWGLRCRVWGGKQLTFCSSQELDSANQELGAEVEDLMHRCIVDSWA